jgi:hypothetical protein
MLPCGSIPHVVLFREMKGKIQGGRPHIIPRINRRCLECRGQNG